MKPVKMADLVSIIIPFYNCEASLLDRAIMSVLAQTYSNIEIVICNDGSDKNHRFELLEVIKKYSKKIKLVEHNKNYGISRARNTAVARSKGKWLVWLDADDELDSACIKELINKSEGIKLVIGECYVYEEDTCKLRRPKKYYDLAVKYEGTEKDPFMLNVFSIQPQLVLREAFFDVNGFDNEYKMAELTDFFLRFVVYHGLDNIKFISNAYYLYDRNQEESVTTRREELFKYRLKSLYRYKRLRNILVDNIFYIGRCSNSCMQTYVPEKEGNVLLPPYLKLENNKILIGE